MVTNVGPGLIQSYTSVLSATKLSEGTCLQTASPEVSETGVSARYDRLELSQEQCQVTLNVPDEITCEVPRSWTIVGETFKSFNDHLQWSLEEADRRDLSFGDRLTFLRQETQNWVEDKRQNDTEMFVEWIRMHKEYIQKGEGDLVGLPPDFTMEDYYSYVKEPFSRLA